MMTTPKYYSKNQWDRDMNIEEGSKWYSPRSDRVYKVYTIERNDYTIERDVWVEVIKLEARDLVHVGDCWRWAGPFPDFLVPYRPQPKQSSRTRECIGDRS